MGRGLSVSRYIREYSARSPPLKLGDFQALNRSFQSKTRVMNKNYVEVNTIRELGFSWPPSHCPSASIVVDEQGRIDLNATLHNVQAMMHQETQLAADSRHYTSKYEVSLLDYLDFKDSRSEHQEKAAEYKQAVQSLEKIRQAGQSD